MDQDHKVNQACVVMPEKEDPVDLLDKMAALVGEVNVFLWFIILIS